MPGSPLERILAQYRALSQKQKEPSLNLLSQSLTEWMQESCLPLHIFAVCSDAESQRPEWRCCA